MIDFTKLFRGLFGYQLITNSAGFRVVLGSGKSGPWVKNGDSVTLVPTGVQEAQFPVELLDKDNIPAVSQVSVQYVFANGAENKFNFAYDIQLSESSGNFTDEAKSLVMSLFAPALKALIAEKEISESVRVANFPSFEDLKQSASNFGLELLSASCAVRPVEARVLQALGATQSEALVNAAQVARHTNQLAEIYRAAARRDKDHGEALAAQTQALEIANKNKGVVIAEATAKAAGASVIAGQEAEDLEKKIQVFGGNPVAFALYKMSTSAANLTVTSDLIAAISSATK